MKINDAVILVGGKGSRLGSITLKTPKPLIKINNKPFLDQLLSKLIKYNFKNIYLLCSYKKKLFFKKYHKTIYHNTKILCIDEGKAKGTGGALYKLKNKINNNFILLNGDTFFNVDLNYLIKKNLYNKSIFMCLTNIKKTKNNFLLNNLSVKKNIIIFSKRKSEFINGGIYLINKNILKKIKNKFYSFENDILKKEIDKGNVIGKYFKDFFIDIGSKQKLKSIKKKYKSIQNKCFFLDRDGVINKEIGYIKNFNNFFFLKGVHGAIKYLNEKRFLTILITNQAVVGKGIITEKKLNLIHHKMKNDLFIKKKAILDDIYFSPYFKYSKIHKYRKNKFDRKPNAGMIKKAIKKWNIDPSTSYFIGDKKTDKVAAEKVNLKFYFKKKISLYKQIRNIIE